MRASLKGRHVSGAERIVCEEEMPAVIKELLHRPKEHDFLKITLEKITHVERIKALSVSSFTFREVREARDFALQRLLDAGVGEKVARLGIELLIKGPNPKGGNMRGAVLLDIDSGERLEPNKERGVRTVRVDWALREKAKKLFLKKGLSLRTLDAVAIATKNIHCGVKAELCWSDDPNYLTGYVASRKLGYVRVHPLKEKGNPLGGRIYFISRSELREVVECLERRAFLLEDLPSFS